MFFFYDYITLTLTLMKTFPPSLRCNSIVSFVVIFFLTDWFTTLSPSARTCASARRAIRDTSVKRTGTSAGLSPAFTRERVSMKSGGTDASAGQDLQVLLSKLFMSVKLKKKIWDQKLVLDY